MVAVVAVVAVVALVAHLLGGGAARGASAADAGYRASGSAGASPKGSGPVGSPSPAPGSQGSPSSPASSSPASSAPARPAVSAAEAAAALKRAVQKANTGTHGRPSVAVADLDTEVTAGYGAAGHRFATASIVKADILAVLLLQRHGRLTSSQRAIARQMIVHSDNRAASALWWVIGGARGLDEANERMGMTATHGGRGGMWGTTTTTASDQLRLLRNIFTDDSRLSGASRAYLRGLMGDVDPDQDWGVPAADTRKGEKYFVKNGWLPRTETGLWVVNSIGSVEYHGHPLLIAAVSDGRHTMNRGVEILETVSRAAAKAVTGS
jgi:hypothetical protein